ncbi:MAG: hypothetical protein O2794_00785 [bacterium]|nr:hypothetical protein [bacterium]
MIYEFYGEECPHCLQMKPLIERLKTEDGVEVESYEVWHDENNANKLHQYDKSFCGGVPFYYNSETTKWICGETSYEELKKLAGK